MPLISKIAGLAAYYGIETAEDSWTTVSLFGTPAGVKESNRVAAEFIKNNPDAARLIKVEKNGGMFCLEMYPFVC